MANNIGELTNPEEFIDHYYRELQKEVDSSNIALSKTGFVGFLLNMLGNIQYDTKFYYDLLFQESFPITANKDQNLLFHSSLQGFNPGFAEEVYLNGEINFRLENLPRITSDVFKRVISVEDIHFFLGNKKYILDSSYMINGSVSSTGGVSYLVTTTTSENEKTNTPLVQTDPTVQISELRQYDTIVEEFSAPDYVFGSYYSYVIDIGDHYLLDVVAEVNENPEENPDNFVEYDVIQTKNTTTSDSEVIFLKKLPDNKIQIQLGSGNHGKYIPGSKVKVTVLTTFGKEGEIASETISDSINGTVTVQDYYRDPNTGDAIPKPLKTMDAKNFLVFNIFDSRGGEDPLSGEELRNELIKYIQSRNNLVSKTDYDNILQNYFGDDYLTLFKKEKVVDSTFYLYSVIYNRVGIPILTATENVEEQAVFNPDDAPYVYEPVININSMPFISPFLYIYDQDLNVYNGFILIEDTYFSNNIEVNDNLTSPRTPALFLEIDFQESSIGSETFFYFKSYEDITDISVHVSSNNGNIGQRILDNDDFDSNKNAYFFSVSDFIEGDFNITAKVYATVNDPNVKEWHSTYSFDGLREIQDVSEILYLKNFKRSGVNYISNIPLLDFEEFDNDREFYTSKMLSYMGGLNIDENRMLTDEIQTRFFDTFFIPSHYVERLTKQGYTFDIQLPLQLQVNLTVDPDKVRNNNINLSASIDQLTVDIAKFLQKEKTGKSLSFSKTEIMDIVHNYLYVETVDITVTDDDGTIIPDGYIVTNDQETIISNLTKDGYIEYTPYFFWWDINNLTINSNI